MRNFTAQEFGSLEEDGLIRTRGLIEEFQQTLSDAGFGCDSDNPLLFAS